MAILIDAGTVRPDQAGGAALKRALDPHHVEHGDAFGDADDEGDARIDRLQDRIAGEGRRHIDDAGGGLGGRDRVLDAVEDRQAQVKRAALAGGDAADHLGAVGDRLLGMKGALRAGEALADDLGVGMDQNGHLDGLLHGLDDLLRGIRQIVAGKDG